jgi:hypothetical protein
LRKAEFTPVLKVRDQFVRSTMMKKISEESPMTRLIELEKLGQSVWFDFIRRSLITSGELQALIDKGVRGITSNPAIFEKAIAGSNDYDEAIKALMQSLTEKRKRLTQHGA